ncbi:MAG: hypothetical protein IJ083_14510 [Clostridia bacterium]|nr:hypothetical protein [Clostridia bacterium]
MRRGGFLSILLVLMLLWTGVAPAAGAWPEGTETAEGFVAQVNQLLAQMNAPQIDTIIAAYPTFATLAVQDGTSDVPETNQIAMALSGGYIQNLTFSVSDLDLFLPISVALISACSGEEDLALLEKEVQTYLKRAREHPDQSFEDRVIWDQGDQARVYYAYVPNQYMDGTNWLTMTLIFPRPQEMGLGGVVTPAPENRRDPIYDVQDSEGDYTPYDEGTHLEIFLTPTPEPDSAAAEEFRK